MDPNSESRLAQLNPTFAAIIRKVAATMSAEGVELRVVQGLRTKEEQDTLFAQGRTAPGQIVTKARGGQSMHNYGLAVDMVPGVRDKHPWQANWDEKHPDFQKMIDLCEQEGLVAGARWTSIPDFDHFQMPGVPVSPSPAMLACLEQGGCQAVWDRFCSTPLQPPQEPQDA